MVSMPMKRSEGARSWAERPPENRHDQTAHPDIGCEGYDEGIHPEANNEQAVDDADDAADDEAQNKRNRDDQPFGREGDAEPDAARAEQDAGDHGGEGGN